MKLTILSALAATFYAAPQLAIVLVVGVIVAGALMGAVR